MSLGAARMGPGEVVKPKKRNRGRKEVSSAEKRRHQQHRVLQAARVKGECA